MPSVEQLEFLFGRDIYLRLSKLNPELKLLKADV